jgi:hypothetical protein
MHGNNTRKLPVYLTLPQTSKRVIFLFFSFVFFFYKIREQEGKTDSVGVKRVWCLALAGGWEWQGKG